MKKNRSLILLFAVMAFAACYSYWTLSPAFQSEFVFMDDAANTICTYSRYVDPELYENDLGTIWADYTKFPGFRFAYYIPSLFWRGYDPILLGNIYTVLLYIIVAFLCFRIGKILAGDWGGFLCAVLMVGQDRIFWIMCGGDARAFARPLLLLFILFMIRKNVFGIAVTIVLQALFYPLIVLVSGLAYFLRIILSYIGMFSLDNRRRHIIAFFISSLLAFSIMAPRAFNVNPAMGPLHTLQQMEEMPEFQPGGLESFITVNLPVTLMGLRSCIIVFPLKHFFPVQIPVTSHSYFNPLFITISFFIFLVFLRFRTFKFPSSLYLIMGAGIFWFYVACLVIFRLFDPSRYFYYPATTLFVFFIGVNYARVIKLTSRRFIKALVICGVLCLALLTGFIRFTKGIGLTDYRNKANLVAFAKTLPKDTLIAGDIWDMVPVYALAKRKCIFQRKTFLHHNVNYYRSMKERLEDFYRAVYGKTEDDVHSFCEKYGIDYIFIPKSYYNEKFIRKWSGKGNFKAPYNDYVATLIGDNRDFYLNRPDIEIIFKDDLKYVWVYRCPALSKESN